MSAPHEDDRTPTPPEKDHLDHRDHLDQSDQLDQSMLDALGAMLRDRMQQAVVGVEPRPGTLDVLRRAVPARRRRRHAAMATTAVTVFAVGAGAALAARGSLLENPEPTRAGGTEVGNLMSTGTSGAPGGGSGHGPGPIGGSQQGSQQSPSSSVTTSATSLSQTMKAPPPSTVSSNPYTTTPILPACQGSSVLSVVGTQSPPVGGVVYETVVGTVKSACTLAGTPTLAVSGGTGKVTQYKPDPAVTPLLSGVPEGLALILSPGDRFEFRFAWVPLGCATQPPPTSAPTTVGSTASSASPTVLPTTPASSAPATVSASATVTAPTPTQPTPGGTTASSSAPAASSYSVSYALSGAQPQQIASFAAACGAALYVTDYFPPDGKSVRHGGDAQVSSSPPSSSASASAAH